MASSLGKQTQASLVASRQALQDRVQSLFNTFWAARYQPLVNAAVSQLQASVEIDFANTVPNDVSLPNWVNAIQRVLEGQDFIVYPPNPTIDPVTRQVTQPSPGRLVINWDTV